MHQREEDQPSLPQQAAARSHDRARKHRNRTAPRAQASHRTARTAPHRTARNLTRDPSVRDQLVLEEILFTHRSLREVSWVVFGEL